MTDKTDAEFLRKVARISFIHPHDELHLLSIANRLEALAAQKPQGRSHIAQDATDAARYRWLREANDGFNWQVSKRMNGSLQQIGDPDNHYLDTAIDAILANKENP